MQVLTQTEIGVITGCLTVDQGMVKTIAKHFLLWVRHHIRWDSMQTNLIQPSSPRSSRLMDAWLLAKLNSKPTLDGLSDPRAPHLIGVTLLSTHLIATQWSTESQTRQRLLSTGVWCESTRRVSVFWSSITTSYSLAKDYQKTNVRYI